jgi:hypothetical protein
MEVTLEAAQRKTDSRRHSQGHEDKSEKWECVMEINKNWKGLEENDTDGGILMRSRVNRRPESKF